MNKLLPDTTISHKYVLYFWSDQISLFLHLDLNNACLTGDWEGLSKLWKAKHVEIDLEAWV